MATKKKDEFSLVEHGIGSKLLEESHKQLLEEMKQAVVGDVKTIVKRKANLEAQVETIEKQINHLRQQLGAIEHNEFTLTNGKINYNDSELDQDCATKFPYRTIF